MITWFESLAITGKLLVGIVGMILLWIIGQLAISFIAGWWAKAKEDK